MEREAEKVVSAEIAVREGRGTCGERGSRRGGNPGVRREPAAVAALFCAAMGFSRRRSSAGGFRWRAPRDWAGAPRVPSVGPGRSAQEDFSCVRPRWPGWDGWAQPAKGNGRNAVRRGWQRRRHRDDTGPGGRWGRLGGRGFCANEPLLVGGSSRMGRWVPKKKKPTSGWKWASDAFARCSSVLPLPVRDGGAFRRSYLVNLPGGDGLQAHRGSQATHRMGGRSGEGVHRAVHGRRYCRKCANSVWTQILIGTSPIFFKGCAKVFFAWTFSGTTRSESRRRRQKTTKGTKSGSAAGCIGIAPSGIEDSVAVSAP